MIFVEVKYEFGALCEFRRKTGHIGSFFAVGSFGIIDDTASYERIDENGTTIFIYCDEFIRLEAEFTAHENGVVIRRDRFFNLVTSTILALRSVSQSLFL